MQIVIKIGGAVAEQPDLLYSFFAELSRLHASILVVHGGGVRVSELSRRLGIEPRFVDGVRMTSDEEMDLVEMVLAGLVNGEVVRAAERAGVRAFGVSGVDGGIIRGRRLEGSRTATVKRVDTSAIRHLWIGGYLPILAPVGTDAEGFAVNINADESSRAVAEELATVEETQLCFLSDVAGVLDTGGDTIGMIETDRIEGLVTDGTITGGMIAKVRAAGAAVRAGIESVRIGSWERAGDLAALLAGTRGTRVTHKVKKEDS